MEHINTSNSIYVGQKSELDRIYAEITGERQYQDKKWGGADHDDKQSQTEWMNDIAGYLNHTTYDFRTRMVKVAALAVAAIQAHDRNAARNPLREGL